MNESQTPRDTVKVRKDPASIRRMFADIAPTYDLLNHLLSANRDRAWRRRAVALARLRPADRVLDVCTGTGDLAFEALRYVRSGEGGEVFGTDFCPEMIELAEQKQRQRRSKEGSPPNVNFAVADTLHLPFAADRFDAVTVGFGIRNVADLDGGLLEMRRVLKPGGRAVILEFTTPSASWFRRVFGLYFHHVLPRIGRWISSRRRRRPSDAYRYLPESVSEFPGPEELGRHLRGAGFDRVSCTPLALGIAAVHIGFKSDDAPG